MRPQSPLAESQPLPLAPESWLPRLLKCWALFALVTFMVMLTHQSDHPDLLGRYSKLVIAQLIGLLTITLVIGGVGIHLSRNSLLSQKISQRFYQWRTNPIFAPFVITIAACLLGLVWVFFLGNHLPTYGFLRLFVASTIMVGALALLYGGGQPKTVSWKVLPIIIIVSLGLVIIAILPYFPPLALADESFVFSMARNTLETGHYRPTIYRQAFPENYYGGVWTWMMAVWLKFGGISLTSGRLYVFILGLVATSFLYVGTVRLYDKVTAWFVVLIGLYAFGALNHIRFDIHTAFWLSLGIFFYSFTNISNAWWAHIAVGLAVGLCIDSNPVGYCFGLGIFLVYAWDYLQSIRNKRWFYSPFWFMAIGGGIALVIFLRIHSGNSYAGGKSTVDLALSYIDVIKTDLVAGQYVSQLNQYFGAFLTGQPILFGLMLLGIITAFIDRKKADRLLLILYFTWMMVIVFAYFYFPLFYLTLALPLFVMLAARGITRGLPLLLGAVSSGVNSLTRASSILLTVWLLAAVVYGLVKLPADSLEDLVETGHEISQIIPTDATVVAAEPYYFGMLDHPNFVGGSVESIMGSSKNLPADAVWSEIKPDAIVFSQNWPTEPPRSNALMSYMANQKFGLQACYETASYGRIELWTRNAPKDSTANLTCIRVCNPRTGC